MAFVAWTPISGRQAEVAAALGGEAAVFYRLGRAPRWTTPLRYALSAAETAAYLIRRRPRAIIATNPPIFPGWIALAFGRLTRAPVLLDSHPGGFGLQGDRLSGRLQPLHRPLVARVDATLVTDGELGDRVRDWGGRAEIVHEAPPAWPPPAPRSRAARFVVLYICVFQRDEPVREVLEAARRMPDVAFRVTGDLRRRDPADGPAAPANVEWVGFLGPRDYMDAIVAADAVLVLTTEPTSVVRGGYEAVWAHRPLVVSDFPGLRSVFPDAVHVANEAGAIARGIADARERHAELVSAAPRARTRQLDRWTAQLAALEQLTGGHA